MVARFVTAKKKEPREGQFHKGMARMPGAGRIKGQPNKMTRLIKDAITGAGDKLGMLEPIYRYREEKSKRTGVIIRIRTDEVVGWKASGKGGLEGYLIWLGANHPNAYATLLGRVLPMQINAKVERTETVASKFSKLDFSTMSLEEKMATMQEMIGLTQARPEAPKLPRPGEQPDQYEEGEFTEIPKEAAE